jgi:hypothetical protein
VRIDYPEPADEPEVPRHPHCAPPPEESRPRVIAFAPSDPAELEAAHRDYQALVQSADGPAAALGSWDRAAAEFRADWAKYEERHPEEGRPAPHNHPDGSWSCGDARKLTPGQNADVSSGYARIREVGERDIVPGILAVEAADPNRHLAGFEHHIKGEDRLKEKVAELLEPPSDVTASRALAAVADAVRFTFDYPESAYADGVHADVERLKGQGFALDKLKNSWVSDQYKGVNSQWHECVAGVRFEVQFHTRASHEAKEISHGAYERLRGSYAQDDEREELKAFQRRVNAKVPTPPGVDTIEDFPGEKRDG